MDEDIVYSPTKYRETEGIKGTNLADNVLFIEKPNIRVQKNRDFGITGLIVCSYDPCNRRIFQKSTGDRTVYSWNHEGIKVPEDRACDNPEFEISSGEEDSNTYLF